MRLSLGRCLLLLALVLLPVLWVPVAEAVAADACLDRGGSFDYVHGQGDFRRNHTYWPALPRWGTWVNGRRVGWSVLLVTGVVLGFGMRDRRRPSRPVA